MTSTSNEPIRRSPNSHSTENNDKITRFNYFSTFRPLLIINAVDESSSSEESISNQPSNIITAPSPKSTIEEIIEQPTKKSILLKNQETVVSAETGKILENNTNNNNDIIINTNQKKEDENKKIKINKKIIHKQNGTESVNKKTDFNLIKIVTDFILNEKKFAENFRKINYENNNKLRERIILGIEHVDDKITEKKLQSQSIKATAQEKNNSKSIEEVKGKTLKIRNFILFSHRERLCFYEVKFKLILNGSNRA